MELLNQLGRPSLNPAGTLSSSIWSLVTAVNEAYAYNSCSAVGALVSDSLVTIGLQSSLYLHECRSPGVLFLSFDLSPAHPQ